MEQETKRVGVLRVFRVEEGSSVHARTLSPGYTGLFTHYVKGKSEYCKGERCDSALHRADRVWKGYAAVELWNKDTKKWNPVVLEISEALELDLRGLWNRGQVWELYRDMPVKKKPMPVMGKLLEQRDPATMPPVFDFKPVLLHLYHVDQIHLGILNPMPPRVMVTESDGDGPAILSSTGSDALPVDPKVEEEWKKKLNAFKKTPTERKKAPV